MTNPLSSELSLMAPVFGVSDTPLAVAYYRDRLLFDSRFEWADAEGEPIRYAILGRDKIELHLSQREAPAPSTAYCFVDGVSAYYELVAAAGASITEEIADQPWEMREFEIRDLDSNSLVFGEHLSRIRERG